jgi:hypothetical protein
MRRVLLLLALTLTGCFNHLGDRVVESLIYGPDRGLMVALHAYREGAGRWPVSPAELEKSSFLKADLHLDRYSNLRFEPLANDGLAVAFDSYVSPDGEVTWSKSRLEISGTAAH